MSMQDQTNLYDVAIIGGGINGIGLFRDLSKHKVNSILIERGDFMSQTSSRSSKMLHGGIRYLENFDFPLIQEALHEKNLWVQLAPHLCNEQAFYLPVFNYSKFPLWLTYFGLKTYDFLSNFKNTPSTVIAKKKLLKKFPDLTTNGLKGAAVYHDALMNDARLGIECLMDAMKENIGRVCNYTILEKAEKENEIFVLTLRSTKDDKVQIIRAKELVFTTGPFTDKVLTDLKLFDWRPRLIASKGTHIWLDCKTFPVDDPMVLETIDKRVLFVLPQKDAVLVGTTEDNAEGEEFFDIQPKESEIQYILSNLNKYFPKYNLKPSDVLGSFAGIRPLIQEEDSNAGKTSRKHQTYQPLPNVWVLLGGKWTTFRTMVQDIAAPLVGKYNPPYDSNKCIAKLNTFSPFDTYDELRWDKEVFEKLKKTEFVSNEEDLVERRLGQMYKKSPQFYNKFNKTE